jgi:nucleoside-diphosphate-sugar epimerase
LGKALVRRLVNEGHSVRSFARGDYPDVRALGAETQRGDLANPADVLSATEGCEAVFHVAAKAGAWGSYESFYQPNVVGTRNVIDACQQHRVTQLVYTSTPSVATSREPIEGADESIGYPDHYDSPYGETKAIAEREVLAANGSPTAGGPLATVALRPRLIWGPGDTQILPRLVERAQRGTPLKIGQPPVLIDTTYIENAVDAHLLAWKALSGPGAPHAGKAYFISNGEPIDVGEMIDGLVGAAGLDAPDRRLPRGLAISAAGLIEGVWRLFRLKGEPPLTKMLVLGLSTPNYFDISAAREDFDYEPRVNMAEGMDRLRAWYTEEHPS